MRLAGAGISIQSSGNGTPHGKLHHPSLIIAQEQTPWLDKLHPSADSPGKLKHLAPPEYGLAHWRN